MTAEGGVVVVVVVAGLRFDAALGKVSLSLGLSLVLTSGEVGLGLVLTLEEGGLGSPGHRRQAHFYRNPFRGLYRCQGHSCT